MEIQFEAKLTWQALLKLLRGADDPEALVKIVFQQLGRVDYQDLVSFASSDDERFKQIMMVARQKSDQEPTSDPRWSSSAFFEWATETVRGVHTVGWLKVGFIRRFARCRGRLEHRQLLPEGALHFGQFPVGAKLFAVTHIWETKHHPDPNGFKLQELAHVLDQEEASDQDLVFCDYCSLFQNLNNRRRTELEAECFDRALLGCVKPYMSALVKAIVLPRTENQDFQHQYLERPWCIAESFLTMYCNRSIIAHGIGYEQSQTIAQSCKDPHRMSRIHEAFLESKSWHSVDFRGTSVHVLNLLADQCANMITMMHDHVGFEFFCRHANLAWVRVRAIRLYAEQSGPFPRRQELPMGSFIEGAPPWHRRKFVVSHGWESEVHPSPSGGKMAKLSMALQKLKADDDDVVFFDFLSNAQEAKMGRVYDKDELFAGAPTRSATAEAYFQHNKVAFISGRTEQQLSEFRYAMWDMGRLYAYEKCEVIVLPMLEGPESFPGGEVWGMVNSTPYEFRGWCCSEFATALKCKRIVNLLEPEVQHVLNSRTWPETAIDYAKMMQYTRCKDAEANEKEGLIYDQDSGVDFTASGDRQVVSQNFFKATFDPQAYAPVLRNAAQAAQTLPDV